MCTIKDFQVFWSETEALINEKNAFSVKTPDQATGTFLNQITTESPSNVNQCTANSDFRVYTIL